LNLDLTISTSTIAGIIGVCLYVRLGSVPYEIWRFQLSYQLVLPHNMEWSLPEGLPERGSAFGVSAGARPLLETEGAFVVSGTGTFFFPLH
jgi:hypothetical protein